MIVGRGDIASVLNDREGAIFFASGVSNSSETNEDNYNRERKLLVEQDEHKCLFYFSTINVDDVTKQNNRYIRHKLEMENIIAALFENYVIIRIGNITWGTNPNTFLNNIRNRIRNNEAVVLRDEYKYMIDKEQLLLLTDNLPLVGKHRISVFGEMKKVKDLI
jgi:dTDP-4-dehydrorhamnose reductase